MKPTALNLYFKSVVFATFVLIAAGGLVTSTGSGLSVPDWPLSYGQVFPPMIGGIRFEHSHRVIAGAVGLMTLAMALLLFKYEPRLWVKNLGLLAILAVILQALLGGLTVIYLLPTWISVAHACLAQTFFCLVVTIAYATSADWQKEASLIQDNLTSLKRLACTTALFIYVQLIVGAVVRHTGGRILKVHYFLAALIVLHTFLLILKISRSDGVRHALFGHVLILGTLVFAQVLLGLGALVFKHVLAPASTPRAWEVLFTAAHQSNGALVLATCALLALKTFRMGYKAS